MKKIGKIIVSCYLGLVVLSSVCIIYLIKADPSHSEFSGVPLVILTLPWSVIAVRIIDQINPYLFDKSPLVGIGVGIFCALINSLIIYFPFYLASKKRNQK